MDCKVPGRLPLKSPGDIDMVTYGLTGLTQGQALFAHREANAFLNAVMMDPVAPTAMKEVIRSQNAVGILMLQELLAAYHQKKSGE